jgi:multiple sugar transport system permease protein
MIRWTLNSLIVAVANPLVGISFALLAGYALARLPVPGKNAVFWTMFYTQLAPFPVTFIGIYIVMYRFRLVDTLPALFIGSPANATLLYFFRQYFQKIPQELLDAAAIDGCGEIRKVWHVVAPLARPVIAAWFILMFIGMWNEFIMALIFLTSVENYTLPVGISAVIYSEAFVLGEGPKNFGLGMAGSVYMFLPALLIFILFQKHFVRNIYSGGIK